MPYSTCHARVLLVGFHPLILEDSRLQAGEEYEIHAISADEDMILRAVDRIRPHVILLDILQTGSLRTIRRLRDASPSCRVVALTGMRQEVNAESLFSAGASGILYRTDVAAELCAAIQTVRSGQRYLSPALITSFTDTAGERSRSTTQLSSSDQLMLRLIAKDFPARRIAQVLEVSLNAVRLSIACLKRQLDQRTNLGLKRYAATHDLAPDSDMKTTVRHPRKRHEFSRENRIDSSRILPGS